MPFVSSDDKWPDVQAPALSNSLGCQLQLQLIKLVCSYWKMLVPDITPWFHSFLFLLMLSLIDVSVLSVKCTMSLVGLLEHNIYRVEVMTALEAFWLRLSFLFLNVSLDVNGNLWRRKFLSLQAVHLEREGCSVSCYSL